jgi:thiol-disulfide isomerase/thioredoxin
MSEPRLPAKPDALLLLTSTCPHCPAVLAGLSELVKAGHIGRLEVVNIGARPDVAQQFGVRSVPWFRIGDLEFEGVHTPAELRQWAERAGTSEGLAEYFHEQLKAGALTRVGLRAAQEPQVLDALLRLLGDPDTELTVRIGVSAAIEGLEGSDMLQRAVQPLIELTRHRDAHIRGDAAHLLSLTRHPAARPHLERLLADDIEDVRDIAREGLEHLTAGG